MSVTADYIETSVFDLFKSGPGPSSSHTIGPMKAAHDFLLLCRDEAGMLPASCPVPEGRLAFHVRLFGSLSATGEGHGTDAAVLAGHFSGTSLPSALRTFSGISRKTDS